jgi:hypothetical protein
MTIVNFTSVQVPSVAVLVQRHENGMANIHILSACESQMISRIPDESQYSPGGGLAGIRRNHGLERVLCIMGQLDCL